MLNNLYTKIFSEGISDISIIIPVYGRLRFLQPLIKSLKNAIKNVDLNISITIVEHSENREYEESCLTNDINYIWFLKNNDELFNKSLAMNLGARYVRGKDYLFHDLDCLVQSDFFLNLIHNKTIKSSVFLQTFTGRRVLYMNEELTEKVINDEIDINILNKEYNGVSLPHTIGAPGGSILIDRNIFLEIGGYDDNLFSGYAPEDLFFWIKARCIVIPETCDNPDNEIFHMYHENTSKSNPKINEYVNFTNTFKEKSLKEKLAFINQQKNRLIRNYGFK